MILSIDMENRLKNRSFLHVLTLIVLQMAGATSAASAASGSLTCAGIHSTQAWHPSSVLRDLESSSQPLAQRIAQLNQLPVDLLAGRRTPTWDEFQGLQETHQALRAELLQIQSTRGPEYYQDLMRIWQELSVRQGPRSVLNSHLNGEQYGPTDYALRGSYRAELEKLNSLMPPTARLRLAPLPVDRKKERWVQESREALKVLSQLVSESVAKTSEFGSKENLVREMERDPKYKRRLSFIRDDGATDFAMNATERSRWWAPKVGFVNQRVSGSSRGGLNFLLMDYVEASRSGSILALYEKLDPDLKPKYGYLKPKDRFISQKAQHLAIYGTDTYIFKKEALADRTTWTAGDSFMGTPYGISQPTLALNDGKVLQRSVDPQIWTEYFIPWSDKDLLAPQIVLNGPRGGMRIGHQTEAVNGKALDLGYLRWGFVELQFWGPVRLSDVKEFIFRVSPPTGEFLQALRDHQIKIYFEDPQGVRTEWSPQ